MGKKSGSGIRDKHRGSPTLLGLEIFFALLTDGNSGTGAHHAGSNASRGGECSALYPAPVAWPGHHQQQGHQKEVGGRSAHHFLYTKKHLYLILMQYSICMYIMNAVRAYIRIKEKRQYKIMKATSAAKAQAF
jgi:hypothetical protein